MSGVLGLLQGEYRMKRKILALLTTLLVMGASQICDAAIRYQTTWNEHYIVAPNNKTNYGQYVILEEDDTFLSSFDYDRDSGVFTVYTENGSLNAIRKFKDRDTLICTSYSDFPSGAYRKDYGDGHYYYGSEYRIWEYSPQAYLIVIDHNGDVGAPYGQKRR